ncbi:EamA/RhaT family transporter [Hahella sp. KA22]|uniref:DMT family transporter n=1 Tax=Hahella sp. KA22 TaxID=1628392 RepID=UPI000FDDBA80|nr:DMT family transporter [Hahella sp. KA22]AZZ94115.1 EamA/RhaT family transporter [Hahella sp. KA22]QAY57489.1 EamA/RhaT family transporter [Hahella sp. KA22]
MHALTKDTLTLLLWVALMASSFVVSADLPQYASPIAGTELRFILATLLLAPLALTRYALFRDLGLLMRYGMISLFLVLFFIGLFEALKTTTALNTSVIYTLVPLMSVAISRLFLGAGVNAVMLCGFVLGAGGALWVLLATHGNSAETLAWNDGDALFLLACASLALHVTLVKKWGSNTPPIQGAFYIMLMGAILMAPVMIVAGDIEQVAWGEFDFWRVLLYLTLFATIATFYLQQHLVQKVGPNRLLAFSYLIPTFVAIGQGFMQGPGLWYSLPGVALTLLALLLISGAWSPAARKPHVSDAPAN